MLRDNLCYSDPFLCLPDFESYSECQKRVDVAFREKIALVKMAILNTARMENSQVTAPLTNTRAIWKVEPVHI